MGTLGTMLDWTRLMSAHEFWVVAGATAALFLPGLAWIVREARHDRGSLTDDEDVLYLMAEAATHRLSLARIAEAARSIDPAFRATPQFLCEPLSDALGAHVVVKVETLNPVRCFKGRGADFYAASLAPGAAIATASSGNLGQALAYFHHDEAPVAAAACA